MRIVFIGAPGAGKGTQSERLVVALGIKHLSTGEMLRQAMAEKTPLGRMAEQFISAGRLVPDRLIIDLIRERLQNPDCSNGFLLDGFPRTLGQAEGLDAFLTDNGTPLDLVLELRVDEDELLRRLLGRGRADDRPDVIRQRFRTYWEQTEPLLGYYAKRGLLATVDGSGLPEQVFGRVQEALERFQQGAGG